MKEKLRAVWKRWKERYSLFYLYSKVWEYSEGNRRNVVLYWIMFIFANIATLTAPPYLMAKIVKIVQGEGSTDGNVNFLFALLALTIIADTLFWCLHGPGRVIEFDNAFRAEANYKEFLNKGVLGLPLDWHADHHSGDSIDKIQKGSEALFSFAASSFGPILSGVRLVGCCALITYFSPLSGIVIIALITITVFITMRFDKVIMKNYKELNLLENHITAGVFDAVSNITTVVILRVEKRVYDAISHKIREPYKLFVKTKKIAEVKWFLVSMCCSVMSALVLGIYFWTSKGVAPSIMVVTFFLLMRYTNEIAELFYRFADMYSEILRQKSRVQNSEILTQDFKEENLSNHILPADWKEIEIKNLNFSYVSDECGRLHLDNLSLSIKRGETIAVIGESGSGKTTLLKVVRDLHHPDGVIVLVDKVTVKEGFGGISRAIALAPQEPEIFARTIRENITLGAEYASEVIDHFVRLACFDHDIKKLPKGLESVINEKGVNLSGGQKQRLALARALLASRGKSIILLDEPTSSVDSTTELRIYKNILSEFKGTSIISSMHRLHLLPLFDRICMFENGKIVRSGSFKELLEKSQEFQKLWENYNSAVWQ